MRALPIALACLAASAAAAGCGGDERAQRAPAPVRLDVTAPADMAVVQTESVQVSGTVEPAGAQVLVMGEEAAVSGGTYTADVALEEGANVIDVMATARNRSPALTAFRVTREMPVEVPDLDGLELPQVQELLQDRGLKVEVHERGGLIEDLLPGEPAVCEQDPDAGTPVRRGTTVDVEVGKGC